MKSETNISQYDKMTKTPIWKLILKLSVPTIISMLITNIYNLADTAFVGKLGNSASGAVGVVFGLMSVIQAIGFMFGQGSGSIISRLLGNKDNENSNSVASSAFMYTMIFGILLSIVCFIFIDPLMIALGSTETIFPYAKTYASFILAVTPFMTACFTLNNILRYEGKAFLGMIAMLSGAILNIFGDALLMFGFKMGIAGAGMSTAISQFITFIILLSMFLRGKTQCVISVKYFGFSFKKLWNIVSTGFPSMLRQGLSTLTTILLNGCAGSYGDEAVAAISIVNRISFFVLSIAIGIGQGFQPVSGFNYGAGKYSRVKKGFIFTALASEVVVGIAAVVLMIFSGNLIALFRDDPTVCEIGSRTLLLQSVALFFLPLCCTTEMMYQSTGRKLGAAILSSLRGGVIFIPALLILNSTRGLYGIEEAQPCAYILAFFPTLFFLYSYLKSLPEDKDEETELKK